MHKSDDLLVFDCRLNESIPFAILSDAKIARLVLTHNVPMHYLDLFLSVLRDPSFNAEELTLSSAKDIFQHIVEFRTN
jgi:hypothetical protein